MIWNGKRHNGIQTFRKRGEEDYLLVYLDDGYHTRYGYVYPCEGELFTHPRDDTVTLALGEVGASILRRDYYPVSHNKLKQLAKRTRVDSKPWLEAFEQVFEDMELYQKEAEKYESES